VTSLLNVYVMPPFAVARLGASDTPVDAFDWVENPATHGAGRTVIRPAVSLRVLPDGSIQPFMPSVILFRDGPGQKIRPTAPFFELWGRFDDTADLQPLTETRLEEIGGSLARVSWRVRAANLKAARRTKSPADGFGAEVMVRANEHAPVPLLAVSPNVPRAAPLVMANAPILLGRVQAIRPHRGIELGVDLDVIRIRFMPGAGEVFGPPSATTATDPDAPSGSIRQYEIAPSATASSTAKPAGRSSGRPTIWSSRNPPTLSTACLTPRPESAGRAGVWWTIHAMSSSRSRLKSALIVSSRMPGRALVPRISRLIGVHSCRSPMTLRIANCRR
jgi:hypothetical protein